MSDSEIQPVTHLASWRSRQQRLLVRYATSHISLEDEEVAAIQSFREGLRQKDPNKYYAVLDAMYEAASEGRMPIILVELLEQAHPYEPIPGRH